MSVEAMAHLNTDLDDLSNIFDIANFDLDSFPGVDTEHIGDSIQNIHTTSTTTPYLDALAQPLQGAVVHDFAEHTSHLVSEDGRPLSFDMQHAQAGGAKFSQTQYNGQAWQHYPSPHTHSFANGMQEQYGANARIPPTPNSYEMHGEAGHFMQHQQQQQALLAQQKHLQNMQNHLHNAQHPAHFTPMTSPSGTPQYAMQPEFTTPGAYFSPLTSPALHAQMPQNQHVLQQGQGFYNNSSTAPNSNAPSPVDLNSGDIEMADGGVVSEGAAKRSRKKLVTPRSVTSSARVRQSPIQKAQKRKSGLLQSGGGAGRELEAVIGEGQVLNTVPTTAATRVSQAFDSSESGSISPEPLSEALMRPPPRPSSMQSSPMYPPSVQAAAEAALSAAAATPKSILSMRSDGSNLHPHQMSSPETSSLLATPTVNAIGQISLDELELPEAASTQATQRSPTVIRNEGNARGPPLTVNTARKTPKLGPLSTPLSARPDDSPSIMPSPASASTPSGLLKDKKANGRSSRSTTKRASGSGSGSAMVSPALRPRISPSIKPLLPEGSSLHSPTHALLLASKSNYQNLLEGNHLPGVNYPDSLSTGLTSKRTSHKVAEQGRRNRINEALKEMQFLIPAPSQLPKSESDDNAIMKDEDDSADADAAGGDCNGKESKESATAKSNSSKAATVESANRYIRQLQESDVSQRAAILALRQENDEIRRRLAEATGVTMDGDYAERTDMPAIQEHDAIVDV